MTHKHLSHEAQIALERAKAAGQRVEALTAQLELAKHANAAAQAVWVRAAGALGLQENDLVTEDYRIKRGGVFLDEPEPPAAKIEQALDDTAAKTNGAAVPTVIEPVVPLPS